MCFSFVSPLDRDPDPKYKPYLHLKNHPTNCFVNDLEVAQNSFFPNSERECLMLQHTSSRALHQDHQHERWMGTVFKRIIYRKRIIIKEEKPTRRDAPRETSGHELNGHETLETRPLGGILRTAEILKENKKQIYFQCTSYTRRNRLGTIFCRCGKKLGELTDLQEKNAQMTIEKGSHVIRALVQLRVVEQTRRGNRHGSSSDQQYWALLRDTRPFLKMHKERNR